MPHDPEKLRQLIYEVTTSADSLAEAAQTHASSCLQANFHLKRLNELLRKGERNQALALWRRDFELIESVFSFEPNREGIWRELCVKYHWPQPPKLERELFAQVCQRLPTSPPRINATTPHELPQISTERAISTTTDRQSAVNLWLMIGVPAGVILVAGLILAFSAGRKTNDEKPVQSMELPATKPLIPIQQSTPRLVPSASEPMPTAEYAEVSTTLPTIVSSFRTSDSPMNSETVSKIHVSELTLPSYRPTPPRLFPNPTYPTTSYDPSPYAPNTYKSPAWADATIDMGGATGRTYEWRLLSDRSARITGAKGSFVIERGSLSMTGWKVTGYPGKELTVRRESMNLPISLISPQLQNLTFYIKLDDGVLSCNAKTVVEDAISTARESGRARLNTVQQTALEKMLNTQSKSLLDVLNDMQFSIATEENHNLLLGTIKLQTKEPRER